MTKVFYYIGVLFLILLNWSCNKRMLPPKDVAHTVLHASNLQLLDGIYDNFDSVAKQKRDSNAARYREFLKENNLPPEQELSDHSFGFLWNQLVPFKRMYRDGIGKELMVQLVVKDAQHVKALLWENEVIKDSILLDGELKRGYFKIKVGKESSGIPAIHYRYSKLYFFVGVGKNGDLLFYRRGESGGTTAIFLAGNGYNELDLAFKRIR